MNAPDFNQSAAVPVYGYSLSPVNPRAFIITKMQDGAEPQRAGDYTVLDKEEDILLSEKKIINIVSLLNGRKKLMQLGHETKSRILYRIVSSQDENGFARILFYHLGQEGNSIENAMLNIKGDDHEPEITV